MRIIIGKAANLPPALMHDMARYRYKVFVEKLGWHLKGENCLEYDQFDRNETVYVIAQNNREEIVGMGRLLPTIHPYLLEQVFPQLLKGVPIPCSEKFWELSRFSAVNLDATTYRHEASSSITSVQLLTASLACVAAHGAKQLLSVSPLGVERLLHRSGFKAHRLAQPVISEGQVLFACAIDCAYDRRHPAVKFMNFEQFDAPFKMPLELLEKNEIKQPGSNR